VKKLTEVASEYYQLPEEKMVILIKENSPENVGIGGQLLLDKKKTPQS
jgi:4-oxalocrotonate tautomerase